MIGLFCFALAVLASPFKSKLRLEAENAVLRHQLIVLKRRLHGRVRLTNHERWFLIQLYRWFPSILKVLTIIRPETLVRWHGAGFRCYWRWKSRPQGGRPQIDTELRVLIRRMSVENPLWGAPRIHGELLKLGVEVAQSSVAKYMVKRRGPPSQGWRTFLRTHAPDIAAIDLFVVPTIGFDLLYAFVIVRLDRRDLVWINVTPNPTAEWVARQITEAFPWNEAPRYLIRDRDRIYGNVVTRRLRTMGIRDKPTAPASFWQNGFAERLIGSIRRECRSHRVVFTALVDRGYRVVPQIGSLGFSIDLVVEGDGGRRLAVECDGDRYHGQERWADDMRRQRILERVGWIFWPCFGSNFSIDPAGVLDDLVQTLERMEIKPIGSEPSTRGFTQHRVIAAPRDDVPLDDLDAEIFSIQTSRPKPPESGSNARECETETALASGDRVVIRYLDDE